MKFKVFSIYEIIYKAIVYFIVISITVASIYYYFSLNDKSDTFIAATLYAMFLFVVGLYLSYMDKKVSDKIYDRRSTYVNLRRVEDLFCSDTLDFSKSQNAKMTIIAFKVLSGRCEASSDSSDEVKRKAVFQTASLDSLTAPNLQYQDQNNAKHYYINEDGFVFTKKIIKIEKEYMDLESELQRKITDSINEYIKTNNIKLKILSFNEMDLFDTNYDEWCDKYIDEAEEQKEFTKDFIYKKIESLRVELDLLEVKKRNVEKYYNKCYKKTNWNIKKLEAIYGNRLQYLINYESNIMQALNDINGRLDEMQREQANVSQIDDVGEYIKDCRIAVNDVCSRLQDTEDIIISAIDDLQDNIDKK